MVLTIKAQIKKIPILGDLARKLYRSLGWRRQKPFPGSEQYWENRYASGGNSGVGSYQKFAEFKAEILNSFVAMNNIQSVIEFGCGDGNQLSLAVYPRYAGFDVSQTVIEQCQKRFAKDDTKTFKLMKNYNDETADLSLSLDVIYHLIEDQVFDAYMHCLFRAAKQYVIIYASDTDENVGSEAMHVKHRRFTNWVHNNATQWKLMERIPNRYPYARDHRIGSFSDFYIYERSPH